MKKTILLSFLACTGLTLQAQITETATEAVKNMGVGWNLGNTLDANKGAGKDTTKDNYWGQQGVGSETYWGQPVTKPALMTMMKEAGFGAIRVPVTWFNHMDKNGKVDAAWMKRVHEIVDYVIDNDLYCIINVHHDNGADNDSHTMWMHADEENYKANKDRYEYLWTQIAEEFKDYDNHLLFAGYNEMLDKLSSWCFASFNAKGQYDAATATSAYNAINNYAQSFVNAVRATGGNNATRNLVVQTYASSNGDGTWNTHLKDPLKQMNLPKDEAKDHIIFEVHAYPEIKNKTIASVKKDVDSMIKTLNDNLISKGAPVIIGEWGTNNVDAGDGKTDYDVRRELMLQFCEYFVQKTKENGIGTFYWMGMSDGMYRSMPAFSQPDLAECVTKAYLGSNFEGKYPEPEPVTSYDLVEEPMTFLNWGEPRLTIPGAYFKSIGDDIALTLTYTFTGTDEDIQLYYSDWKSKPTFQIGDKTYAGDYNPHVDYDGSETYTTTITFSEEVAKELASKGLIVFGHHFTLTKAVLANPNATALDNIETIGDIEAIYDLSGHRVSHFGKGIFIKGNQKLYVK